MTEKRFIKFMFIGVDDATLRCGVQDNLTGKEYHTVDNMNAKELTDLLNEQHETIEQLKQLLDYADDLIQSHLSEHFIRQWRNFKTGHKEYNDFWEEKLKKHKELKEDLE